MGLSLQVAGRYVMFAAVLACAVGARAQADRAPDFGVTDTGPEVPALTHVRELLMQGHLEDALAAAQAVIEHPPQTYITGHNIEKSDQMNKARAYNLEGYAYMKLEKDDEAFDAWSKAAEMGNVDGIRSVAFRLMLKMVRDKTPGRSAVYEDRMDSYFLACAELIDPTCLSVVPDQLKALGDSDSALYWFLLTHILKKETEAITKSLSKDEQVQLDGVMRTHALAPPVAASPTLNLPARSALSTLQLDLNIRFHLQKEWRFFWDEHNKTPDQSLLELFRKDESKLKEQTPFADSYLLLAGPTAAKDANIIHVKAQGQLMENLQNGDSVVARCGQLTHMTVVWSVDAENVYFLDPFYEFWQPTHDVCVKHMKLVPYKYSRELVEVPRAEVGKMLEAVITVRDARAEKK